MHQLSTPEQQFARQLADDPSRPFVTFYDESSGERAELSRKSLANWVAKTHHLLATELGLGPGDTALIALPAHWISVPVLLGCLTAGLELRASGDADVAFVTPDSAAAADGIPDVYAIAPASAAVGLRDAVPPGVSDYVAAVRPQADAWASVAMLAGPKDAAWPGTTRGDVLAAGRLEPGARLLTTREWHGPEDWLQSLFAVVGAGGSLVIVRNASDEIVERRAGQERATARLT